MEAACCHGAELQVVRLHRVEGLGWVLPPQ